MQDDKAKVGTGISADRAKGDLPISKSRLLDIFNNAVAAVTGGDPGKERLLQEKLKMMINGKNGGSET